jgi:hypothetical protein
MLFFFKVSNNRNFSIESERKSSNFNHNVKIIAMKSFYIAAVSAAIVLSSCSVYRSGQTPDDVYYSPAREKAAPAYVEADNGRDDGRRYEERTPTYSGYDDYASADDRWLMMRVRNRSRWSVFDDYDYGYGGYGSGFGSYYSPYSSFGWGGFTPGISLGFGSFYGGYGYGYDPYGYSSYNHFNNYYGWNNYYNPYYGNVVVVSPKTNPAGYTRIRNFNMNTYSNSNYNNSRAVPGRTIYGAAPRYNTTNSNTNTSNRTLGNSFRRVFSNSNSDTRPRNSYSAPAQDRPTRTYSPSNNNNNSSYSPSSSNSNSGSSGSSSSGGSSSGSRPSRR